MNESLPVPELRRLLSGVAEHGSQHLSAVEADLGHTSFLLSEAIEKLTESFMAVHQSVNDQQMYLDELVNAHGLPSEAKEKLQQYRQCIGTQVNSAVTSLQFHDLTTQLNARTVKRVTGLRSLFNDLLAEWDQLVIENKHQEMNDLLKMMSEMLNKGSTALEGGLHQSVKQKDMCSGEVDLF